MEINGQRMRFFALLFLVSFLFGCSPDPRDSEIQKLKNELSAQAGTRAANLNFAEREAGVYQGCIFLFNICPAAVIAEGESRIKFGFTGASSYWFWLMVIGKTLVIGGFFGALLWLPLHLKVVFTQPLQDEMDAAKALISETKAHAEGMTKRMAEFERLTDVAGEKAEELDKKNAEKSEKLAAADEALQAVERQIAEANLKLEEMRMIRAAFKQF